MLISIHRYLANTARAIVTAIANTEPTIPNTQ